MKGKLPAKKYIKTREDKSETIILRVTPELKEKALNTADRLNTSYNSLFVASLEWYCDALDAEDQKKEKA